MINIEWKGRRVFEATPPTGNKFVMDAYPESGGQNLGPTPLEAFIAAGAACSAMDVIQILEKKRQRIASYRIEIDGERAPEGKYPRPYTSFRINHIVEGEEIDEAAVAQAVQLSDEKYCTVIATLRAAPNVESSYEIRQRDPAVA